MYIIIECHFGIYALEIHTYLLHPSAQWTRHSGIVRGNFTANGQNHGRPTYRKDCLREGLSSMFVSLVFVDNKWMAMYM